MRALRHLLLGELQTDPAAADFPLLAEDPDLAQEHEHVVCRSVVERALGAPVAQLRTAPDARLPDVDGGPFAGLVHLHRPDERRAELAR